MVINKNGVSRADYSFFFLELPGDLPDAMYLTGTEHGVYLRDLGHELFFIPLGKAAGHYQGLLFCFVLGQFKDGIDGFLFGITDKGAGVHQQYGGMRWSRDGETPAPTSSDT